MFLNNPSLLIGELQQPAKPIAKILMVDDNELARRYRPKVLTKIGFYVETAKDGFEAIKMIKKNFDKFDAILMNYIMPGFDGIETTKIIKGILGYTMPIIGFSCGLFDDKTNYKNGINAGMIECIDTDDVIIIKTLFEKLFPEKKNQTERSKTILEKIKYFIK